MEIDDARRSEVRYVDVLGIVMYDSYYDGCRRALQAMLCFLYGVSTAKTLSVAPYCSIVRRKAGGSREDLEEHRRVGKAVW